MSFADQLRQAPDEQKKKEERLKKADFDRLIDGWYKSLKEGCMRVAKSGGTSYCNDLSSYVEALKNEPCYDGWWNRIKPRVCCELSPSRESGSEYEEEKRRYGDVCVTKEDADYIELTLKKKFEDDGLNVQFKIKEKTKYKLTSVYVKFSDGDRLFRSIFNDDDREGTYKTRRVEDGYRYQISISVSW